MNKHEYLNLEVEVDLLIKGKKEEYYRNNLKRYVLSLDDVTPNDFKNYTEIEIDGDVGIITVYVAGANLQNPR